MDNLFGGKPKTPTLVQQAQPVEKVQQSNIEREKVMTELAKRKRATLLSENLGAANVKRQTLGAGV